MTSTGCRKFGLFRRRCISFVYLSASRAFECLTNNAKKT
nr:MAG TPA: hypothetical protein [Caudoviricetes sp.]